MITFSEEVKSKIAELLGYSFTKEELSKIAGFSKDGIIKNDFISLIELSDKMSDHLGS